jgi:hypothetical protein
MIGSNNLKATVMTKLHDEILDESLPKIRHMLLQVSEAESRLPAILVLAEREQPEVHVVEELALRETLAKVTLLDHEVTPWDVTGNPILVCVADGEMISEFWIPDFRNEN